MSTDRARAGTDPELRRYRITLGSALGVLVLLVGSLTAATATQGPRITSVQVSAEGVVERDGARLRMRLDRPVAESVAERVTVTPAAGFDVSVVGTEITLAFTELLRYGTEYTVAVAGAESPSGTVSDLETRFTTASTEVLALETAPGGDGSAPDRLTTEPLVGGESRTVFEAEGIRAYASSGSVVAVVVEGEGGEESLEAIGRATGERRTVPLPAGAAVGELRGSTSAPRVGFTVTTADGRHDRTLYTLDVSDPEAGPVAVAGADGAPLAIAQWAFEPGSTSIAALTVDGALLRIDAGAEEPTPLGEHAELRGFVPGTSDLVVADPEGGTVVDLRTGAEAALAVPIGAEAGTDATAPLLLNESSYLRTVSERSGGALDASSAVVLFDGYADRELYRPQEGRRIDSTCLSSNGQYLAVLTVPTGAPAGDGAVPPGARTALVDVATGAVDRELTGASLDWC